MASPYSWTLHYGCDTGHDPAHGDLQRTGHVHPRTDWPADQYGHRRGVHREHGSCNDHRSRDLYSDLYCTVRWSPGTVSYVASSRTAVFTPTAVLAAGTTYHGQNHHGRHRCRRQCTGRQSRRPARRQRLCVDLHHRRDSRHDATERNAYRACDLDPRSRWRTSQHGGHRHVLRKHESGNDYRSTDLHAHLHCTLRIPCQAP